jgi:hypothetical protein
MMSVPPAARPCHLHSLLDSSNTTAEIKVLSAPSPSHPGSLWRLEPNLHAQPELKQSCAMWRYRTVHSRQTLKYTMSASPPCSWSSDGRQGKIHQLIPKTATMLLSSKSELSDNVQLLQFNFYQMFIDNIETVFTHKDFRDLHIL